MSEQDLLPSTDVPNVSEQDLLPSTDVPFNWKRCGTFTMYEHFYFRGRSYSLTTGDFQTHREVDTDETAETKQRGFARKGVEDAEYYLYNNTWKGGTEKPLELPGGAQLKPNRASSWRYDGTSNVENCTIQLFDSSHRTEEKHDKTEEYRFKSNNEEDKTFKDKTKIKWNNDPYFRHDDVHSGILRDYSYGNCINDQKKTFEAGHKLFGNVWSVDGEPGTKTICQDNLRVENMLKLCDQYGFDTKNLKHQDGTLEPHDGGSCFMADIEKVGEYCNVDHFAYKGLNGYPAQDIPAPTIRDDGTIDYDGIEGAPACLSLRGIAKVWNDITSTRKIGDLNLAGTGALTQDLNGLLTLKKACTDADIAWNECTEPALNVLEQEKLRQVMEDTLQAQLSANTIMEQQKTAYEEGNKTMQEQVRVADESNQIAAQIAGVSLDTSATQEDNSLLVYGGAGTSLILCCFLLLIIVTFLK